MILIITNRKDYTADYLILELKKQGLDYLRFNTEDFPFQASIVWKANGEFLSKLSLNKRTVNLEDVKSVWYRRPVPPNVPSSLTAEKYSFIRVESIAAISGVLQTLQVHWVSRPECLSLAESKLYQLKVASELGFLIPDSLVTNDPMEAKSFVNQNNARFVAKPLKVGKVEIGEKQEFIFTNLIPKKLSFGNIAVCPTLLQRYVDKSIEIRVTIIGKKIFSVSLDSQKRKKTLIDWRRDGIALDHRVHKLPVILEKQCFALVKKLGIEFGAIDMILTPDGDYYFLEINPNGQWAWIEQKIVTPI